MTILGLVVELGKSRMDVLVEHLGVRRRIRYRWYDKEQTDVPPANWVDHVEYEMQDVLAKLKRGGVPFL